MRRFLHVFILSAVSAALFFVAGPSAEASPKSQGAAATAPASIKIAGVTYVDAGAFFTRQGFKWAWIERGRSVRFQSRGDKIDFEHDKREISFNGMRMLMGEAAVLRGSVLYISRIDAEVFFRPILSPSSVKTQPPPALRVIAIDAGHGGQDTGTQNKPFNLSEKVFTLDVANRLRALLVKEGYQVVMTRTDDRFIELARRAEIANKAGADLFISIHFNSVAGSSAVKGSETYVMTPRYQRSTSGAKREASDNIANPGNAMDPWNSLLGYHMHAKVLAELDSADRGFKRARFAVLRLVNSPGVLIEAGYLSNNEEARRIATPAYRAALAKALADGVKAYALAITTTKR